MNDNSSDFAQLIDLPYGWVSEPIGRHLIGRGSSLNPSKFPDEIFELFSVPSYETGMPELVRGRNIGSSKQFVCPGQVLLCKINPRINRAWIVGPNSGHRQIASTEWIIFDANDALDSSYLRYYLSQNNIRSFLASNVSGVGGSLMRVKPSTLAPYPIVIAPRSEQSRIASKIDELFSRIEAGENALNQAKTLVERYRKSVLKAAVTGELTRDWREKNKGKIEPADKLIERILKSRREAWKESELAKMKAKTTAPANGGLKRKYGERTAPDADNISDHPNGWVWATIGQLFSVNIGSTPSRKEATYWNGDIPWVSSGEVAFCRIQDTREKITNLGLSKSSTKLNPPGTVLVAMIGEGKTRGQAAILDIAACNNQNAAAIRVSESGIPPEFIYYFFVERYEESRRAGRGGNQPALNKLIIENTLIPLPPLSEIELIVTRISAALAFSQNCLKALLDQEVDTQKLRQSVLKSAFEGRLVPQDSKDEPGSTLLARIRGQSASPVATRSVRSKKTARLEGGNRAD